MKKTITLLLLFAVTATFAQKELWGTMSGYMGYNYHGYIFKTDANGQNPVKMHTFDSINGKQPRAPLFLASNGKLYGTTALGGYFFFPDVSFGVLYEYDLILNKFKTVNIFGNASNPNLRKPLYSGVIEPIAGTLTGAILSNGTFRFNMATEVTSIGAVVPQFLSGGLIISNEFTGELTKASDGFVYGTTRNFSSNPDAAPYIGAIAKINTTTNSFTMVHPLSSLVNEEGWGTSGSLIEALPNKLYGTTPLGGNFMPDTQTYGGGVLFEYNFATNNFVKKIEFDYYTSGIEPFALTKGNNGKLYGITVDGGGVNPINGSSYKGTLFEYNPAANTINILYRFIDQPQVKLLAASDGNLYGINAYGVFKFDLATNTFTQGDIFDFDTFPYYGNISTLIEICRKPSYQEIDVDTFDGCVGGNFSYDVQNTNATTYQWLKDAVEVLGQTNAILNLTDLNIADAGNYTCLMTNECGTTTTMVLHLTVNCLGTNTVAKLDKSVKLYPNPTHNWLNIELPQNIAISVNNCTITNLLGQTVYQSATADKIDVSNLQKGIYIVSLQTNYGDWNGKFVKE